MTWTRVRAGVLRLRTASGPHYIRLTLMQRLRVIWVFRNFRSLSLDALCSWQRDMLEALCHQNEVISWKSVKPGLVIGTLEGLRPLATEHRMRASGTLGLSMTADRQTWPKLRA